MTFSLCRTLPSCKSLTVTISTQCTTLPKRANRFREHLFVTPTGKTVFTANRFHGKLISSYAIRLREARRPFACACPSPTLFYGPAPDPNASDHGERVIRSCSAALLVLEGLRKKNKHALFARINNPVTFCHFRIRNFSTSLRQPDGTSELGLSRLPSVL
jgi:hypothetical protein